MPKCYTSCNNEHDEVLRPFPCCGLGFYGCGKVDNSLVGEAAGHVAHGPWRNFRNVWLRPKGLSVLKQLFQYRIRR